MNEQKNSSVNRVRIVFKSYDYKLLDELMKMMCKSLKSNGMTIGGPILAPSSSINFTLRRAPKIYKGSMEGFTKNIYSRIIFIYNVQQKDLAFLSSMSIPHLVDIKLTIDKKTN